jgi:uncharacterized membrane protein
MSAFLKIFGRFGGIITLIILLITLVRQLISLVGFLLAAIKIGIVVAFIGLMLLIVMSIMRGRARHRREEADI